MKQCIFLVFYFVCFLSYGNEINIKKNMVIESALLLNAISDVPAYNQNYPEVKRYWRTLFSKDKKAEKALNIWLECGVSLSYMISGLNLKNIDELLTALENPQKIFKEIESNFDEPLYKPAFEFFKKNYGYLKIYFEFLKKHDFPNFWEITYKQYLDRTIVESRKLLQNINSIKFFKTLNLFTQSNISPEKIELFITALSGGVAFKLSGWRIGIPSSRISEIPLIFPHELCHHFNPTNDNLSRLKQLANLDIYYKKVFTRIYGDFREGLEEEFVYASGLYLSYASGIMSKKNALNHIKYAYF